MTALLFATQNPNKVKEVADILGDQFEIITPNEIGFKDNIEETGTTLKENALLKVDGLRHAFAGNIFAEDTGLEVEVLNGDPGVYTARYAGENASADQNMDKLLEALKDAINRNAQFKTILCLYYNKTYFYFEGICKGTIATEKSGETGFGYDPIFIPNGHTKTFAQLGSDVKKKLSHRAMAMQQLILFLKNKKN